MWRKTYGINVFINDNGKVLRGLSPRNGILTPYRWNPKSRGWDNQSGILSIAAIRAGMSRGTIQFK